MYLLDTNILLRFLLRNDPTHLAIRNAVTTIRRAGESLVTTAQNIAEFWNVCTRPSTARGGIGLSIEATEARLQIIERNFQILQDSPGTYAEWKRLIVHYSVRGVQVHDARIVAAMKVYGIANILTLNADDFRRYKEIATFTPADIR